MKITSNQLLSASQSESIKTINSPLEFFTPLFLADPGPRFFWDTYNKLNLNFDYFKSPSVSNIIKNQSLKREAWVQLKLLKAKLNEF